jgi:hypothetical protein
VVRGWERVTWESFDNCDLLAPAGSTRQRQQPQALSIGSNPLGQGGQPQEQAAGVVDQPSRRVRQVLRGVNSGKNGSCPLVAAVIRQSPCPGRLSRTGSYGAGFSPGIPARTPTPIVPSVRTQSVRRTQPACPSGCLAECIAPFAVKAW